MATLMSDEVMTLDADFFCILFATISIKLSCFHLFLSVSLNHHPRSEYFTRVLDLTLLSILDLPPSGLHGKIQGRPAVWH